MDRASAAPQIGPRSVAGLIDNEHAAGTIKSMASVKGVLVAATSPYAAAGSVLGMLTVSTAADMASNAAPVFLTSAVATLAVTGGAAIRLAYADRDAPTVTQPAEALIRAAVRTSSPDVVTAIEQHVARIDAARQQLKQLELERTALDELATPAARTEAHVRAQQIGRLRAMIHAADSIFETAAAPDQALGELDRLTGRFPEQAKRE